MHNVWEKFAISSFLQECVVHSVRNYPKNFESGSDGEKKLEQIFSRRLTHPKDRT